MHQACFLKKTDNRLFLHHFLTLYKEDESSMYKIQLLFISTLFFANYTELNAGKRKVGELIGHAYTNAAWQRIVSMFPLHEAASSNNVNSLIALIDQYEYKVDEVEYPTGETALYKTTIYNCPHAAYALLVRGASIGYKKKLSSLECLETPTYSAVAHNNLVVLALLWYICGDDDFFDAPSKITGLRPSELAQEKKSSLAKLIQEGEQALLEFYQNDRVLKASMEEAKKIRLESLKNKKREELNGIANYKIDLKERKPKKSLLPS